MKNTLPSIVFENNKPVISDVITCEVHGEMSDGTKVWIQEDTDKAWKRVCISRKCYFIQF